MIFDLRVNLTFDPRLNPTFWTPSKPNLEPLVETNLDLIEPKLIQLNLTFEPQVNRTIDPRSKSNLRLN